MKFYIFISAIITLLWTTVVMVRLEIYRRELILGLNDETDKSYSVEILYSSEIKLDSSLTIKYKFKAITKDQKGIIQYTCGKFIGMRFLGIGYQEMNCVWDTDI